jgi:hypothetical protein
VVVVVVGHQFHPQGNHPTLLRIPTDLVSKIHLHRRLLALVLLSSSPYSYHHHRRSLKKNHHDHDHAPFRCCCQRQEELELETDVAVVSYWRMNWMRMKNDVYASYSHYEMESRQGVWL